MASKAATPSILLLSLNLLFFTCVTSTYVPCPPIPTKPHPKPYHNPYHKPPHKYPPVYPLCPSDTLKLGVCANVLNLVNVVIGGPSTLPCCALLEGLADLEAAVCLCTAIKANILGLNLNIPISLSLVLDSCSKNVPAGFQCA